MTDTPRRDSQEQQPMDLHASLELEARHDLPADAEHETDQCSFPAGVGTRSISDAHFVAVASGQREAFDEETDDAEDPPLSVVWDAERDTPMEEQLSRLESLLFVSAEPLSPRRLAHMLNLETKTVRGLLATLVTHYENRGILLAEVAGGYQFRSAPRNAPVVRHVFDIKPMRLSRPAIETLAIIAYRQPLTRAEVEEIRGVDCGGVLKFLFEKGLIRIIGRKETPGRPSIWGTSQMFLDLFGLRALGDLPPLHEFSELWDEHKELVDTTTLPLPGLEAGEQASAEAGASDASALAAATSEPETPAQTETCDDSNKEGNEP
ncbi:MAG: SMC-Scp complex subunit ScpB [Myxococcota bacterium]|jgi:segregation and condensation protein B|nr:SMC-Scp complex subunit ScpB [Myxococcota bacterium]